MDLAPLLEEAQGIWTGDQDLPQGETLEVTLSEEAAEPQGHPEVENRLSEA